MSKRSLSLLFLLFFIAISTFSAAQTQITSGVIQGTVIDPSGAVVPGAEVSVRNIDTNFSKTLTTDADGRFVAVLLPPGSYKINVVKSGFANLVQENVVLTVGQTVHLSIPMKVAGGEQTVVVTSTPTVDVDRIESSSTINQTTVNETPILGRKFEDLLTLTPGVSVVQGPDGDEITFNGQRGIYNNVSIDGGDFNNGFFGEQSGGQRTSVDIPLESVREFQVVASGASAEFGRTGGGVINVITKSGTNNFHGSIFHFQRLEALTSATSTGESLKDFHREQTGAALGGPIVKDKAFFFITAEQVGENFERANLSRPLGTCAVATPTVVTNEALINGSAECQRLALLNFYRTRLSQEEGLPVRHPVHNTALLGKLDMNFSQAHQASISYNFNVSRNLNQTFDVATYGNSANGTEGTSTTNTLNFNLFSTFTNKVLNEAHFTYGRENRPRAAVDSNVPADTAMGFATTFRFGAPFFLQPGIDELFWRTQVRDNVSVLAGKHNVKFGGDWLHSRNAQVFRGFFTGRYIFDSVAGFLRYASPAAPGGFGPRTVGCSNGTYVTAPTACPVGTTNTGGPLLLYLQGAGLSGLATDAAGASDVSNEDLALFIQDKWQVLPNFTLNLGLRWEAQLLPDPTVAPAQTAYGALLGNPAFPSDGTLPSDTMMFQPRVGFSWDVGSNQRSVLRGSFGIYNGRLNMLSQVGSITTNGVQQQTIFSNTDFIRQGFGAAPVYPGVVTPTPVAPGTFPLFSGVRVFDRNYRNPRIYTTNFAFEQELLESWSAYADFTWSKGVYLTNFLDYNRADRGAPFSPQLGEVAVTSSRANSLYRGLTLGTRKRMSHRFQMDMNYTFATDYDNDSNERDPFSDRSPSPDPGRTFNLRPNYSYSDRDIRHKFNFVTAANLPWLVDASLRIQARSAQPLSGPLGRNTLRKDNAFSSVDWRVSRPIKFGDRYAIIPILEMFNTFNSANNINPLVTPGLFNFDGFLRQGVGDPRQVQLAVKFTF
ncbi:MAG TPA: carboxypeptidase regulatory-like domain-containing protein [Terriglobales bacterium]|nr:carboxypeptidase regulatory-like domain-containing protein [Terriglobales bacterium]